MTAADSPHEPVILFTHEGTSYEYMQAQGRGPHGEALVVARKRTATTIDEQVVLKSWPTTDTAQAAHRIRARLTEEARLGAYLNHPAILRVHGPYEAQGVLYTVVEYAPGISLTDLVTLAQERGRYPSEAFALYLGAELASALHHAHTRVDEQGAPLGIVHRNLHPDMIRVTWEGTVKLGDFGLAHSLLPGRVMTTHRGPRLPAYYTAPEVLLGAPVSVSSELFALGSVLLEVCTGRNPLDAPDKTPHELKASLSRKGQRRVRRRIRELRDAGMERGVETAVWGAAVLHGAMVDRAVEGLSEPVKALFRSLFQTDPSLRPRTAAELEEALRGELAELRPYGADEALAEVEQVMSDAGASLVEQEVGAAPTELFRSPKEIATR